MEGTRLMCVTLPNGYLEISVIEAPLQGQNIQALIGRDDLKHGVFIYQGPQQPIHVEFLGLGVICRATGCDLPRQKKRTHAASPHVVRWVTLTR